MIWPQPPDGVSLWFYVFCLAAGVLITGIAKAGFGGGVGILAVPLFAAVLPAKEALGMLLPLLIVADLFTNLHHLKNRSPQHLGWLVSGAIVGIVLGTAVFLGLQYALGDNAQEAAALNRILNLTVGGLCVLMVAAQVYRLFGRWMPRVPPTATAGRIAGVVAGFISTLAHSAGPVVSVYLLEQRLDKRRLVGTAAVYFLVVNCLKVPTFVGIGAITGHTLAQSLWVLPIVPMGTLVGYWMHKHVAEKPFVIIMYLGAAAAAVNMIYKGLM
jgi:uncharacterized membrane protein YfcA